MLHPQMGQSLRSCHWFQSKGHHKSEILSINIQMKLTQNGMSRGESSKFPKPWTFDIWILNMQYTYKILTVWSLNDLLSLDK